MSFWTSSKREFRNCNFTDMNLVIDWFCNSSKVLFHWNSVKHQSPGHGTKDFGVKKVFDRKGEKVCACEIIIVKIRGRFEKVLWKLLIKENARVEDYYVNGAWIQN